MKAESIGSRTYALVDDNQKVLGQLSYEGWFSQKAHANFGNQKLHFAPQGFWGTTIEIQENNKPCASISMNWLGNTSIQTTSGVEYFIKYKGFWKSKFIFVDSKKEPLIEFVPTFRWGKWAYEYDIEILDKKVLDDPTLILIAFYTVLFVYRTMTKGAS